MEIKEVLRTAIQEWIVPELDKIRLENAEIRSTLQLTNKRLDDIQAQLIDQSRRIDETNKRIDETNKRIDETNKRIDKVHDDLLARIDETHRRIDHTNARLDRLYEVVVKREEHSTLESRVAHLEEIVDDLRLKLAA